MFIELNEVTSIDPKRVAQPSFEHLDVKVIGTQIVDFDDIFMDSSKLNKTRSDIFPTPNISKTTNKTAVIILFISNESILIIIILDV